MAKLWQKNYTLDSLVEEFTVGRDYLLDQDLIVSDCLASLAHGRMLHSIGILDDKDLSALEQAIRSVLSDKENNNFLISREDEDGHTALENRLVELAGDAGKKIHTGRSRNDQVITAIRVFARSYLLSFLESGIELVKSLRIMADKNKNIPMPGRTHMQTAMPSSVGLWAGSFAEELMDNLELIRSVYTLVDQSPLGSAASYGVPLPLDRELTARELGFSRVQRNVLYVNNSRGKTESMILDALDQTVLSLSKMAQDLILFSLPEFGYFSLPDQLCSGSSIMPQKKNPDGLELMRARSASLGSYAAQVKAVIRSLPSGYNRDFQETKEPFLLGCRSAHLCLRIMTLTIQEVQVNEERLTAAFTPDIYATDAALELVAGGMSFRDAYKEVGLNLEKLGDRDPLETIKNRTHTGTTGNLGLEELDSRLKVFTEELDGRKRQVSGALTDLAGYDIRVYRP